MIRKSKLSVLVACECSGIVRDAFIARGHDAISCDMKPTEKPGPHYQGDVRDLLENNHYDILIGHPPCTYLASISAPLLYSDPTRMAKLRDAVEFFRYLMNQPIKYICIENPRIMINITGLPRPSQTIQPYYFGHPYTKATCLWLKGLPLLRPTDLRIEARCFDERIPRTSKDGTIQTYKNGQLRMEQLPTAWVSNWNDRVVKKNADNATDRSRTFQGIADAMAEQWGAFTRPYGFL